MKWKLTRVNQYSLKKFDQMIKKLTCQCPQALGRPLMNNECNYTSQIQYTICIYLCGVNGTLHHSQNAITIFKLGYKGSWEMGYSIPYYPLYRTPSWAQSSSVHQAAFSVDINTLNQINAPHIISTYPSQGHE